MASLLDMVGDATVRPTPAVALIDAQGYVVGWTLAAEELLGYGAEDILGRPGTDLLMPDAQRSRIWEWSGGAGDQQHRSGLSELRHRDGRRLLVRLESSRLGTVNGRDAWTVAAMPAEAGTTSLSVLRPLLSRAPIVVAVWDRALRCIWLNEGARRLRSALPYFEVGRSLEESEPGIDTPILVDLAQGVLDHGNPMIDREFCLPAIGGDEARSLSSSLFRVEGVDGQPLGVCLLAVDTTHSRARERLALIREASVRIGTTLDVRRTAQELADLTVPALADFVTVDLAESVLPESEPLERLAYSEASIPVFYRAGMASIHEDFPESLWHRGTPVYVPPSSPFTAVLAGGRSHFEPEMDIAPGTWLDNDPERARVIRATGMHSLIIVPLKARGEILGIAVFVRNDNEATFNTDDLALAEELTARAALSLDNARRYTREHTAALALQRHLLPRRLSGGGAVDVASHYMPSDSREGVSGDWFDVIGLSGSRIALVVGDVTGHGINAAAGMGRLRTAVRTLAYLDLPAHELLIRLDDLYARQADEDDGDFPLNVIGGTVLYAVYDPVTRRCTMASAGHPPPAVVDPSGGVTFPELHTGTPIGLGLGSHESVELDIEEGTLMVLYTDGLIESRGSDLDAGMQRLSAALGQASDPLDDLCHSLISAMVRDGAEDDVTLLLARTLASP